LIVNRHRLTATLLFTVVIVATLLVPVASAQGTGRFERCAIESTEDAIVIAAYTVDDQNEVQLAAGLCANLISTGAYIAASNEVDLDDSPDLARVCVIEYPSAYSLDVYRSVHVPPFLGDATLFCRAADGGSARVTYD
jgi:hypothetical protein